MKKILLSFVVSLFALASNAQIGYQVSLLNTATGEPRANETVSCTVKLMNSKGGVICNETKSVTSNDLGVLSLTVGGPNTFAEMDWTKLPLSVSVSVGGQLIGQSQVLTVPVAEYAKKTGVLTYENIGSKRVVGYTSPYMKQQWSFAGRTATLTEIEIGYGSNTLNGTVRIDGNSVFGTVTWSGEKGTFTYPFIGHYSPEDDTIYIVNYKN